jgi:TP901 family phage tail tape measure protein
MEGMEYTPILTRIDSADSAIVSMLEDSKLSAQNLGEAAKLLGKASEQAVENAAQQKLITQTQKQAILWLNQNLKDLPEELVKTIKDTFTSLSTKMTNLAPSVVQEATRTLVLPLIDKMIGGLNVDEIGRMAMAKVKQSLGLDNLNKYSAGYRAIFDQIYKEFGSMLKNSQKLSNQFEKAKKTLANTVLTDFSATSGSQAVNKEIVILLKQIAEQTGGNVPTHYINNKDMSGSAQRVTRTVERMQRNAFSTQKEAENVVLQYFDPKKLTQEGKNRAKQAAEYAANMQKAGYGVSFARDKGSQEIKVIVYDKNSANAFDRTGKVNRQNAATASFAVGGLDKRNDDYVVDQAKRVKVSDAEAQKFVEMSRRAPTTIASARAKIRDIKDETVNKSTSKYDRQDNLYGVGADKALVESRTRFENEVKRLVAFEQKQGSTLSERELTELFTKMFISFAGHGERDTGVQSSLRELQTKKGLSAAVIREFNKNFSWLPQVGSMGEEDSGHYRLWGAKEMKDKMALVTRKIQGRDIQPYANQSKPERVQNIEVDINRLFEQVGNLLTSTDKKKREAAEVIDKNRDLIEGLVDGMALVSKDEIENLDTIREGVSVKISKADLSKYGLEGKKKKSAKAKLKAYKRLLAAEGREATKDNVDLYVDPETGDVTLTGRELVRAHTGTKANSAYGNLRVVYREVSQELIKAISTVTGIDLTSSEKVRATVVSAREETSSRNIGPLVTRAIDNAINELDKSQIEASVKQLDTSKLSDNIGQALIEVLLGKLSFSDALDKYVGSNVSARTKFTGETLYLLDELTGGKNEYEIVDGKLLTKSIASSFTDIVGTRYGEYAPRGAASLPTNWEIEDLERSARAAGVKITPENSDFLRTVQLIAFGATREDIENKKKALQEYNEHIERQTQLIGSQAGLNSDYINQNAGANTIVVGSKDKYGNQEHFIDINAIRRTAKLENGQSDPKQRFETIWGKLDEQLQSIDRTQAKILVDLGADMGKARYLDLGKYTDEIGDYNESLENLLIAVQTGKTASEKKELLTALLKAEAYNFENTGGAINEQFLAKMARNQEEAKKAAQTRYGKRLSYSAFYGENTNIVATEAEKEVEAMRDRMKASGAYVDKERIKAGVAMGLNAYEGENYAENLAQYLQLFAEKGQADAIKTALKDRTFQNFAEMVDFATNIFTTGTDEHTQFYAKGADGTAPILNRGFEAVLGRQPYSQAINLQYGGLVFGKEGLGTNVIESNRGLNKLIMGDFDGDKLYTALVQLRQAAQVMKADEKQVKWLDDTLEKVKRYNEFLYEVIGANIPAIETSEEEESVILDFKKNQVLNEKQMAIVRSYQNQAKNKTGNWSNVAKGSRNVLELQEKGTGAVVGGDLGSTIDFLKGSFVFEALEQAEQNAISSKKLWEVAIQDMQTTLGDDLNQVDEETFTKQFAKSLDIAINKVIDEVYQNKANVNDVIQAGTEQGIYKSGKLEAWRSQRILATLAAENNIEAYKALDKSGVAKSDLDEIAKTIDANRNWESFRNDQDRFKVLLHDALKRGAFNQFGFSVDTLKAFGSELDDDFLEKAKQAHGRFREETGPTGLGTAAGELIKAINKLVVTEEKVDKTGFDPKIVSILEEIRDLLAKQGRGGLNERYGKTYMTPTGITASLNPYYGDESAAGYLQGKIIGFKDSTIDWTSLSLKEKADKFGYTNTKQFEKDRESVVSTFIGTLAHAFSESQVKENPNLFSEAEEAFKKNLSMLFNEKEVAKYLAIAQEYGRRGYDVYDRLSSGPDAYRAAEENVRLKEDDYIVKGKTDAIYTSKRLNEKGDPYQIFNILDFKNKAKIGLDSIEQVVIYVEMYRRIKQELDDMIRSGTGEENAYKEMSKRTLLSENTLKALHESLDVSAQIVQNYGGKTKVYDIANAPRDIAYALTHGFSLTKDQEKKLENAATASPQLTQTASAEFQAAYKAATGEEFGVEDYKKISVSYEEKLAEERALKEQLSKAEQGSGKDSILYQKLAAYYEELRKEIGELDEQRNQLAQELSLGRGVRAGATRYARKETKHSLEMGDLKFGYEKIIEDDDKQRLLAQKQREAALKQYKQYNDQIAKTEKDMLVLDKQINTSPSKLEKGLQADKGQIEILKAELRELVEKRNLLATNNQFTQAETAEMDAQLQKKRELNKLKVASMAKGAGNWLDVIGSGVKNTITRMFDYNGVYRILNRITQGLRQIVQQVTELDTAMFNLQVVSGDNREEVSALINDYSKLAKQLHTTTTQIAASANEWLRQGYEAGQANELIKASTYLSKLGMIEAGQATTYLTSMIKGFKLEAADAVNVVDKLTAVDMEAAVSAGGIAAAMQNVATTAQMAGLSLDKTIGYISTIIETTQRDPSSVGMGMRTILARYGNVKAGVFTKMTGMENSDADLENINDIEKVLGKVGIRIRENAQEFRSFGDVIDELSLKWQKYDSVTKNAIATAMAGVRQRESFLVLMENKERADELEDVSATSKGTADTKYEAYQQTLSAAKADLQTALQDLAKSIHDSGLILRLTQLGTILTKMIVPGFNMLASALWARNSFKLSTQLQYSLEQRKAATAASQGLSARKIQEESLRREEWRRAFYEKKEGGTKTFVDKLLGNMPESFTEANKVVQEFTTNLGVAAKNVKNFPNGGGGTPPGADDSIKETALTVDENSSGSKFRPWDYTPYQKESTYQKGPLKGRTKLKYFINPPGLDKKKLQAAIDSGEITEGQAAKMKLDYKRDLLGDRKASGQQMKDNVPGAIGAGITSALTTGFTQEGSAGAKATAGITAGALTGIGAAFGPVGAAIGSTLGSILGPLFAKLVDKEETERKERAEDAQKQLDALNSLNNTFEGIHEYTEKEYLTSEAILAIKESVDSIDEQMSAQGLDFDDYLKQAAVKMNLGEDFQTIEGIRELLTAADEKTRQKAQEVFDLAQSMAKVQTTKESKAVTQMSASEYRTYLRSLDKEYIKQAYAISGLEQSSLRELSEMNLEDAVKKVAEQFKKLGVTSSSFALYDSEGNVTEQAIKYITDQLRKSDRMQEMLNGSVLTLTEALQDKDKNANVIESFASALGVSTTRLEEMSDQLGALKLSDFVKSASQLREMLNDLYGILDSYYETGYLDLDAQEKILSNYPEYADLISDPGKIAESINEIVDGVKVLYVKNSLNEWAQNEKNAETYVKDFLKNNYQEDTYKKLWSDKKYFGDLSTPEQMLQRIDMLMAAGDPNSNILQAVKDNIEKGMKNYESIAEVLAEQLENTKKLESVNKYLDKSYEKQINALEEQKSALEQINSQREYENKLIEAKIKLENAQNEKKKVWREGVGWVYEADTSAIAEAQKELEDLDNEKKVNELQTQIDELQAQRDYLGDIANKQELEGLKKVYEDWQKEIGVSNVGQAQALEYFEAAYTKIQNLNLNPNKTGSDGKLTEGYLQNVTDQRTKNLGALKGKYSKIPTDAPDTTADYTTESFTAIKNYNDSLKDFKNSYDAYIGAGGSDAEAAKTLGISEKELQQKKDAQELKLLPKRGAYFNAGGTGWQTYKTIYTTWQPNSSNDAGFLQAKPWQTYVLLNDGYWGQVSTLLGIEDNTKLRDPKYSGLIFMEEKGTNQLFWNYEGGIYKASLNEGDWGRESGVDDSTNHASRGHNAVDEDYKIGEHKDEVLAREGFRVDNGELVRADDTYKNGYATGTLSAPGGLSLVNDDPQYGLEGIITPQGTLTALPSKSGVVPADMTRNVWQLGEVAPNLIKQLVDINGKFNSPLGFGTDESFNVDHLDVHMVAQPGFDMDDFVRQLRAARDLSKHS